MRKNLIQPEAREEIISRLQKLTAQTKNHWGKMNVNQMLLHLSEGMRMMHGEITSAPRGNWIIRKMMRYFIFNSDMATPKGKAKTFPEIDIVALGKKPADFEAERSKVIDMVKKFPAGKLHPVSPLLGKMNTENWGRLTYTHIDHHLKQFGV